MYEAVHDMNHTWGGPDESEDVPSPLHGASRAPAMAQGFWSSELDAHSQPVLQTAAGIRGQFWVSAEGKGAKHTHGGRGTRDDDRGRETTNLSGPLDVVGLYGNFQIRKLSIRHSHCPHGMII